MMSKRLAEGVYLQCFPTKKFKTVRINIYFKQKLTVKKLSDYALLSRLLDLSTAAYPNQSLLNQALSHLYGASFSTYAHRQGNAIIFQYQFVFPNSKFISQANDLKEKNMEFIRQALFHPHAQQGSFDPQTFQRQQSNLLDEIDSLSDDKQLFARLRLNQLYYPDSKYQLPAIGRGEDVASCTPESLYRAYEDLINQSELDILIMGDVDEDYMTEQMKGLGFKGRSNPLPQADIFYRPQLKEDLVVATDRDDVHQGKFNLAYDTGIYYLQDNYFAGLIFNGLFGGYPHSKLFLNVREKESLAYYASSSISPWTGKMTVQTGIDSATQLKTNQIIADQLKSLQDGDFSLEDIDQTKKALRNSRYQNEDSSNAFLKRVLNEVLATDRTYSLDEWLEALEAVNKDDVIQVAQQTQLKASYFLSGGDH